jgi:hypothetical protein
MRDYFLLWELTRAWNISEGSLRDVVVVERVEDEVAHERQREQKKNELHVQRVCSSDVKSSLQ